MASQRARPSARRRGSYLSLARLIAPALLFIFGLALLFVNYGAYTALPEALSLRQECRMSRMWPSYELHHPPSPSGQGKKYRLYLYRENPHGRGAITAPRRKPALFIPGNAGSYGQVRSVASWSWHDYQREVKEKGKYQAAETDWWSIDFNEDFSALHSTTLEGQSIYVNEALEYIVSFYIPSATISIPILAHSMGGIVARSALLQGNHPAVSPVKTIITLSTPHHVPPAPIERDMDRIYQMINGDPAAAQVQQKVLLVSLSGGILDTQLPSEYSTLPSDWAPHVLQHFTSDLPALWSNVDHLAMMWCDQLRRRVAVGVAGEKLSVSEEPMAQRKQRWSQVLQVADHSSGKLSQWTSDAPTVTILSNSTTNVDAAAASNHRVFTLLTSLRPLEQVTVLLCRSEQDEEQTCQPLPPWAFGVIPPSRHGESWTQFPKAEKYYEAAGEGLWVLDLDRQELVSLGWDTISIQESSELKGQGWWEAGWSGPEMSSIGVRSSEGLTFDLTRRPLVVQSPVTSIHLPQVASSLFVYDFTFTSSCQNSDASARFAAMVHIYNSETGDGRWFPSLDLSQSVTLPVSIHATSPYISTLPGAKKGLTLELYASTKSECRVFKALEIKINWSKSVGLWLSRYRLGAVSWMMAIFSLSARSVMHQYVKRGTLPDPVRSLLQTMPSSRSGGGLLLAFLVGLAALQWALVNLGQVTQSSSVRNLLFGLTDEAAASFGLMSSDLGLTLLLGVVLVTVTWTLLAIITIVLHIWTSLAAQVFSILRLEGFLHFDHDLSKLPAIRHTAQRPVWKLTTLLTLLISVALVKLYVPYQFVFLAATLMQMLNVIRSRMALQNTSKVANQDCLRLRFSQNILMLLHFVLLLPLRGPSLIIFVRNFLAGYMSTSSTFAIARSQVGSGFGEDHDILRIMPVLALVQVTSTGRLIEIPLQGPGRFFTRAIEYAYLLLGVSTLAWGIRYPYLLYDISLWIFTLILAGHYLARWRVGSPESPREVVLIRKEEGEDEESVPLTARSAPEDGVALERRDQEEREVEREVPVMPFSIPDELMPSGGSYEAVDASEIQIQQEQSASPQHTPAEQGGSVVSPRPVQIADAAAKSEVKASIPTSDVDSLLIEYLSLLDDYLELRETLSATLSKGFFNLSSAQMAAGGWGTTAGARRSLWDARLTREVEVDTQKWTLRDVERSMPEEVEEKQGPADQALNEKSNSGLRRRKPVSASATEQKAETAQSATKLPAPEDEKEAKTGESSKPAPLPPSALYQFSALPSAKLRRARHDFRGALEVIVQGAAAQGTSDKKVDGEDEKSRRGGGKGDSAASLGLVQMSIELQRLEEAIRHARKGSATRSPDEKGRQ
ncbi:PGAP1-domain-containing protein [Microstroma glucosiphilum]|uniref:GPI inositol-deacylase n=1 Tax=Pseudomicrostroma glucosiphilum TaxID=1684307 RepID=A0A316U3L6_9BASI|nr:PGAP1-domain-containing protein [Pseudomicrostroma glucosiphilum]PWN19760.1 PGAP1-domain-containing protein [Pseudomicrostroma glucosiphilum]